MAGDGGRGNGGIGLHLSLAQHDLNIPFCVQSLYIQTKNGTGLFNISVPNTLPEVWLHFLLKTLQHRRTVKFQRTIRTDDENFGVLNGHMHVAKTGKENNNGHSTNWFVSYPNVHVRES